MARALNGLTPIDNSSLTTASATGSSKLGKDQFLKLLLAQLQNQDPTAPTDNQQMIAQLAQFSSVEQAETTNKNLESLLLAQATNNQTAASNLIGKDIVYSSDKVALGPTGGTIVGQLAGAAKSMTITVTDANGKVVDTIKREQVNPGRLAIEWTGRNAEGVQLPQGTYTVKIEATDAGGNAVTVTPQGTARCTGVTFEGMVPRLMLNGTPVGMNEVFQVLEPTPSSSAAAKAAISSLKYAF
jgi:flagellar basal-body rod modification protein FlgD